MALELHDPELDALAGEVSRLTGEAVEDVLRAALRERLASERGKRERQANMKAEIDAIVARVALLPVLDPRSPDEILGYDENGLPS